MSVSKCAHVLERLLARGDNGLSGSEASRHAHDTVLPSTVSAGYELGVVIESEFATVPGFAGHATRLARYWIPRPARKAAREILVALKRRRWQAASQRASESRQVGPV